MNKIKKPHSLLIAFAGLTAIWVADIINHGFSSIGIMILLFIPILYLDHIFPQLGIPLEQTTAQKKPTIDDTSSDEVASS